VVIVGVKAGAAVVGMCGRWQRRCRSPFKGWVREGHDAIEGGAESQPPPARPGAPVEDETAH
jgi:hypothetical protein